jgi:hypothetical protein
MSASPLEMSASTSFVVSPVRRLRSVSLAVLLAATAMVPCGAAGVQDPPGAQEPPPLPNVIPGDRTAREGPWVASDDQPAAPGRIPDGTSDAARERFGKLAGRLTSPANVRSFVLRFDLEQRTDTGTQEARRTEFRYLDEGPGWVYGAFLNKDGSVKQCQMRGPRENGGRGYWQILKDGTEVDLRGGDDFSESRAELDGWAALCHDLLLLQQPGRLRLVRLAARTAAPAGAEGIAARALVFGDGDVVVLPDAEVAVGGQTKKLAERAAGLEWLEIVTPDIRLWRDGPGLEGLRRVLLGIDPSVGVPELALLTQRIEGRAVDAESTLMHLADWRPLDGRRAGGGPTDSGNWLPHSTRLYELRPAEGPERDQARFVFKNRARLDLFLLPGGTLGGTPLEATSFRPPSKASQDPPR